MLRIKRSRLKDIWHLCSCLLRKVISHTLALMLNQNWVIHLCNLINYLPELLAHGVSWYFSTRLIEPGNLLSRMARQRAQTAL